MGGWNFIDRTNMRFGKLVAQKYLGNKNGYVIAIVEMTVLLIQTVYL